VVSIEGRSGSGSGEGDRIEVVHHNRLGAVRSTTLVFDLVRASQAAAETGAQLDLPA
jgi:hypothetical protein